MHLTAQDLLEELQGDSENIKKLVMVVDYGDHLQVMAAQTTEPHFLLQAGAQILLDDFLNGEED